MDFYLGIKVVELIESTDPIMMLQIETFKQTVRTHNVIIEEHGVPLAVVIDFERFSEILKQCPVIEFPVFH